MNWHSDAEIVRESASNAHDAQKIVGLFYDAAQAAGRARTVAKVAMGRLSALLVVLASCGPKGAPSSSPPPEPVAVSPAPDAATPQDTPTADVDAAVQVADVLVAVEYSACRAIAPSFKLTVERDGAVTFIGERNVKAMGEQRARLDDPVRDQLVAELRKRDLAKLEEHYRCEPTAKFRCSMHPCDVALRVAVDGTTKTFTWADDVRNVPAVLTKLANHVIAVTGAKDWIGEPDRR